MLVVAASRSGAPAQLVDVDAPVATADDLGLTRGDGCFEGLRLVADATAPDGAVVPDLQAHLARMQRSARSLDLPDDPAPWTVLLHLAAAEWASRHAGPAPADEAAVKLSMTRGRPGGRPGGRRGGGDAGEPTVVVTVSAMDPAALAARRDGLSVVTLTRGWGPTAFADAPWLLGGVKTLSYAVNVAAQREAQRRGADDVLFTATDGSLLEAPTSAVLWVPRDGGDGGDSGDGDERVGTGNRVLCTVAPGANGILRSTSQQRLFRAARAAGWDAVETTGTVADLRAARAVLLTSAVRGPVAVRELDGEPLAGGRSPLAGDDGAVVAELQRLAGFGAPALEDGRMG